MKRQDAEHLFAQMHPGFFERPYVKNMNEQTRYDEQVLFLEAYSGDYAPARADGIRFGYFGEGDVERLKQRVAEVDKTWVQYFGRTEAVYCAFDGEAVVSFCLIDDMGEHELGGKTVKVAGPGCVGTVPTYRRRGIGLDMVQNATKILKDRGYDLSYIHHTGVGHWYAKLGYETILTWGKDGFVGE